jgi:hypothetical protein
MSESKKAKAGGLRDQETYNRQWERAKAEWYRRKAEQKELEKLATTSLKDLIK